MVIAVLTSLASATAAGSVASLCVNWYRMTSRDGGEAWFIYYLAFAGLVAGFVIGAITSRLVHSGFWMAQGYSLFVALGICLVLALATRIFGDFPPLLDGNILELEVELKSSPGWRPEQEGNLRNWCWLQPVGPAGYLGRSTSGAVQTKRSQTHDQWIVSCAVDLLSSRPTRLVRLNYSEQTDLNFSLPALPSPGSGHQQWSAWSGDGISNPVNKKPITGYEIRYRIRPKGVLWQEQQAAARQRQ